MEQYHDIFNKITELITPCNCPAPSMNPDGYWQFKVDADNITLVLSVAEKITLEYTAKKHGFVNEPYSRFYQFKRSDIKQFECSSDTLSIKTKRNKNNTPNINQVNFMFSISSLELPSYLPYKDFNAFAIL